MWLLIQTLVEGSRQQIPYPAPIWDWKCVQSDESRHINVLEFVAVLIHFRKACCETSFQHTRAFHIFDSRVCNCVIAKGRSSSKVLNRPLRRYCALALASDSYILPLWIII